MVRGDRKQVQEGGPWAEVRSCASLGQGTGQALGSKARAARQSGGGSAVLEVRTSGRAGTPLLVHYHTQLSGLGRVPALRLFQGPPSPSVSLLSSQAVPRPGHWHLAHELVPHPLQEPHSALTCVCPQSVGPWGLGQPVRGAVCPRASRRGESTHFLLRHRFLCRVQKWLPEAPSRLCSRVRGQGSPQLPEHCRPPCAPGPGSSPV